MIKEKEKSKEKNEQPIKVPKGKRAYNTAGI